MKTIRYLATFGEQQRKVELKEVSGTGGLWFLQIDDFYLAHFTRSQSRWSCCFQEAPEWVTAADMQILCDMVADAAHAGANG